jgi:hypothetical protein
MCASRCPPPPPNTHTRAHTHTHILTRPRPLSLPPSRRATTHAATFRQLPPTTWRLRSCPRRGGAPTRRAGKRTLQQSELIFRLRLTKLRGPRGGSLLQAAPHLWHRARRSPKASNSRCVVAHVSTTQRAHRARCCVFTHRFACRSLTHHMLTIPWPFHLCM